MNLLDQLTSRLNTSEKHIATLTGQKADGTWIARTIGGAIILLKPTSHTLTIGNQVYYDKVSGEIMAVAPSVAWGEWGV